MNNNTTAIKDILYPLIEKSLDTKSEIDKYKKCVSRFISFRTEDLYDNLPCSRLYFGKNDIDDFLKTLNIQEKEIKSAINKTYYSTITNFNPRSAKSEFPVAILCVIRYFLLKDYKKELELAMIHMAFSGQFYASIHYKYYRVVVPKRHIMEYVVNNELSNKFDLVSSGSVIDAIKSMCRTWVDSYKDDRFKNFTDEDVVYLIQQLHTRIDSFIQNIAKKYYEVYYNKDSYMTYDSDSLESDNYHLADSDSFKIQRIVEKTINKINNTGVDYSICKMCSDSNIKPTEIQSILESILNEPANITLIKELIQLIVTNYFINGKNKNNEVRNIDFITYSISPKPNAKQKEIVRQKEIITNLLEDNSIAYLRRKSRIATKNSYERAIIMYVTLIIHNANR